MPPGWPAPGATRRGFSDAVREEAAGREARRFPRRAGVGQAAALPRRVLAFGRHADRRAGLRRRLHFRRGAGERARPARHRPHDPVRGGATRPTDRARDGAARHHRRRYRLRRADERRPHGAGAGGDGARRLPSRGSGESQALRPPGAQGDRPARRDGAQGSRRFGRAARRELRASSRARIRASPRGSTPPSTAPRPMSMPAPT